MLENEISGVWLLQNQSHMTGYPTFLFFKNGEKIMEIVGGNLAEATLYDWINILLASSSSSSKKSSKTDDETSEF